MPIVESTPGFEKAIRRIKDERRRRAALRAVELFIEEPHRPGLNFERLKGTEAYWSIRASGGDRVILRRRVDPAGGRPIDEADPTSFVEVFVLVDVGSHDIYRKY